MWYPGLVDPTRGSRVIFGNRRFRPGSGKAVGRVGLVYVFTMEIQFS